MTQYLVLPILLLSLVSVAAPASSSKSIRVEILCDKDQYFADEDIWIDILVINEGDDTITAPIAVAYTDYLRFTAIDSSGDTVPYYAGVACYDAHPTAILQPGDTLYNVYNFADGTLESPQSTPLHGFPFVGSVKITATYWQTFNSNTLSFNIVPRHGIEEEAYTLIRKANAQRDIPRSNVYLAELLQRYPESVYAPAACFTMICNYDFNDSITKEEEQEGVLKFANYIVDRYPESGRLLSALASFAKFNKMSLRKNIVQSLLRESSNFRTRMIARNIARNIAFF